MSKNPETHGAMRAIRRLVPRKFGVIPVPNHDFGELATSSVDVTDFEHECAEQWDFEIRFGARMTVEKVALGEQIAEGRIQAYVRHAQRMICREIYGDIHDRLMRLEIGTVEAMHARGVYEAEHWMRMELARIREDYTI